MVKFKIEWSIEAKLDLIDILEFYVNQNNSVVYSRKLHAEINKNIRLISKSPQIGIPTDYDSVKILIKGNYQIIYEIFDQLILIIMLWDCRRNPEDKIISKRVK